MKVTDIGPAKELSDELAAARQLRRIAEDELNPAVARIVLKHGGAAVGVSGVGLLHLLDAVVVDRIKRLADLGVVVDGDVPGGWVDGGITAGSDRRADPFAPPGSWPSRSGSADLARIGAEIDEPTGFAAIVADLDRRSRVLGLLLLAGITVAAVGVGFSVIFYGVRL